MDKKIYRAKLKCSSQFSGYYKFEDIFQIYEISDCGAEIDSYFCAIEYIFPYSDPGGRKEIEKNLHLNFLKEIVSLFSIASNEKYSFMYEEGGWPRPACEGIEAFSDLSGMWPLRKNGHKISQPMRFNDDPVAVNSKVDCFFKKYFSLPAEDRDKYKKSVFMYCIAEDIFYKAASLAIIAHISAIENLVVLDRNREGVIPEKCSECGQVRHKISSGFWKFMEKYAHLPVDSNRNNRKLIENFYKQRSSMVHDGFLLGLDENLSLIPYSDYEYIANLTSYVRTALFRYLLKY